MEINAKTKLHNLLSTYPQLEEKIIQAAPAFKNLKNPVLRRTVGQLATVEKVVQIGGLDLTTFINLLRREVGQPELIPDPSSDNGKDKSAPGAKPDWTNGKIQFTVDGKELLAKGEVPVNHVNALLPQLEENKLILLVTDFEPIPMIEALKKQKRKVFHMVDSLDAGKHLTYIK